MRNTTGGRNARKKGRYWAAFLVLAALVLIFMVLSICIGTVNIPVSEIPGILGKNGSDDTYTDIVMGIRFPPGGGSRYPGRRSGPVRVSLTDLFP